jgi:beta-glucosidase
MSFRLRALPRRNLFAMLAIGMLAVVLVVASSAIAALTGSAHAADSLLSQGKPTTASSIENAGTPAADATDGNTGTRWSSAFSDPQWLDVDLGQSSSVHQVVLNWESAYAKAFQIQTSTDNTNWTSIYSTTTGAGGVQTLTVSGTGRYVRMYGTVRATGYGYSLWEFQVYGSVGGTTTTATPPPTTTTAPPGTCGTTNVAQGKTATASSVNGGNTAPMAVDGNTGTRWESVQGVDPQWLQVDLGSSQSVCGVTINWETAAASAFTIQLSTDGTNWTTAFSTTTNTAGVHSYAVSGTGRYVKMNGTARTTQYG